MSERVEAVAEEEVGTENLNEAAQNQAAQGQAAEGEASRNPIAEHEPAGENGTAPVEPTATTEANGAEADEAGAVETPEVSTDATAPEATETSELKEAPESTQALGWAEQATEPDPEEADAEPALETPQTDAGEEQTSPDASTDSADSSDTSSDSESTSQSDKKVVRTLAVGEQVTGTVKRIADFGAFIDIGVGRDGLIHISELSVRRVGKVTDMLQEGQEVTAWIKKLDRERNRISLTLIDPDTKTIRDLEKGDVVQGRVTRLLPYGAFVDIGIGRDALLHVREMAEGFVAKPEDVVQPGEELEARIIDLSRRRSRVDLSLKGLRPEPEAATPPQAESRAPEPKEEVVDDTFEDAELLSPMELAFKRAMEAEGADVKPSKRGKRNRRLTGRDIQDEIISRTLDDRGR